MNEEVGTRVLAELRSDDKAALSFDSFQFIKASAMLHWNSLPRCQDVRAADVYHGAKESAPIFCSHRWLSPEHPDPEGSQLAYIQHSIRKYGLQDRPIFYDFCSLPQHPRTNAESDVFHNGLLQLTGLLSTSPVIVILSEDYEQRAWCFFELAVASFQSLRDKDHKGASILNIDEMKSRPFDEQLSQLSRIAATYRQSFMIGGADRGTPVWRGIIEVSFHLRRQFEDLMVTNGKDKDTIFTLLMQSLRLSLPLKISGLTLSSFTAIGLMCSHHLDVTTEEFFAEWDSLARQRADRYFSMAAVVVMMLAPPEVAQRMVQMLEPHKDKQSTLERYYSMQEQQDE